MGCCDGGRKEGRQASEDGDWETVSRHFLIRGKEIEEASTGNTGQRSFEDGITKGLHGWRSVDSRIPQTMSGACRD